MHRIKIIALVLLCGTVGTVVLQNRAPVKTTFLFASFELPLVLLLSLTALAGFAAGLLVAALAKSPANKPS